MSNKAQPLISVYMPTKNRGPMLKRAIDSILAQDIEHFELVVVDDGSTDDTPALLAHYQNQHHNFRFYRNEQSQGVAKARNLAIEKSLGKFVTGCDDDDWFEPQRLTQMLDAYDPKYAFVCTGVVWDYGERRASKVADTKAMIFDLNQQLSYNHATTQVLVERMRMLSIGGFDTELVARIDYDGWTRLIEKFGAAKRISAASYNLSRDDGVERVTTSARNIKGNHQFVAKHRHLMNEVNITNQEFWDMYAQNKRLGFIELLKQLVAGYGWIKFKYFVRVNFLPNWR